MGLESKISDKLNQHRKIKRVVKTVWQRTMYQLSPKIRCEGEVMKVSPDDSLHDYFFGYYDKCPWDASGRYMLCLRVDDASKDVSPAEPAQVMLIDTENENPVAALAETRTWNVQQGCMLQWLGPDCHSRIIYNDFRDGEYVSVILTLSSMREDVIHAPVYSVSADGRFALTLDFSRLHRLRPGYGYHNLPDLTAGQALPDSPCIWRIDLASGVKVPLLKYTDLASFEPRPEMSRAVHKVNHLMLNPSGDRFMFLHRWILGGRKYSRLLTCDTDGSHLYNLSDDDMVSHCCWKNDSEILAFARKRSSRNGYYLMKDRSEYYEQYWPGIDYDGHPGFSPDGSRIVFDRYPDRARIASVMVSDSAGTDAAQVRTVARVFAPFRYDNDTRCDLHPRWSRDGRLICIDAAFEGRRGVYIVNLE